MTASEIDARKTVAMAGLIEGRHGLVNTILVVGCGSGQEAGILASRLGAQVVGIDVTDNQFDPQIAHPASLRVMDAQELDFADASFDFVYSFHALEHIPDKDRALAEMRRVLRPDGGYLIGTPNKTRLVGYINSSAPVRDRLRWNIADYRCRLTGSWVNELGAHAGFSEPELVSLCKAAFGNSQDISDDYYARCYPQKERLMTILRRTRLHRIVYPCVYVTGSLRDEPESS
jgi:SAM-dependent methyltransferase